MGKYKFITVATTMFCVAMMILPAATPAKAYVLEYGQDKFTIDGTMKCRNAQVAISMEYVFQSLPAQTSVLVGNVEYILTLENVIFGVDDPSTAIYDPASITFNFGRNGRLQGHVEGIALYVQPSPDYPAGWVPVIGYGLVDFSGILKISGNNYSPLKLDGWYTTMSYWPGSGPDPA
ncbi:MAG: hypothetical protein V1934_03485 [Methanobacteriota archaeon]